jgi:adenylate cyclase
MTHTHRVLVVDDDQWMRDAMVETLAAAGCEVVGAYNGTEGLRRLDTEAHPCVIFLDLRMPEMDGRQFMDELHRRPALAPVPVVVITGYGTAQEAQALGAVDWLKKPFMFDRLPDLVARHCGARP